MPQNGIVLQVSTYWVVKSIECDPTLLINEIFMFITLSKYLVIQLGKML
jgi:hypothetical protein